MNILVALESANVRTKGPAGHPGAFEIKKGKKKTVDY